MEDTLETLLAKVNNKLDNASYYYLSNDPERALGLEELLHNIHIVHIDNSQIARLLSSKKINTFCLKVDSEAEMFRSSIKLIRSEQFLQYFNATKKADNYIQTFKISPAFEMAVKALNAVSVNTSANLNRKFENKLSQFQELSKLPISLPKTKLGILNANDYQSLAKEFGDSFVIQFDRGHTGSGTIFIKSQEQYQELVQDFPDREVKFSEYITGEAYTLNACVLKNGVAMAGLCRQITGIKELTPQPGATVGNDWSYHLDLVNGSQKLAEEVTQVGDLMRANGYLGMFGVDLIVLPDGSHKFIEINARQPASIPMCTKMQLLNKQIPLSLLHIAEFLGVDYSLDIAKYNTLALTPQPFAQIFVRAMQDEVVHYEVPTGYYRLQGDNAAVDRATQQVRSNTIFLDEDRDKALLYYAPGYDVSALDSAGMLLLTPEIGRKIKSNEEIGRLQLRQGAFANASSLKPWIVEALVAIRDYQL